MPDREKAKELICEIVAVAGGRLAGKVRLHKAFYLAHLIYWEEGEGVLSDYPIVRLPFGPGIDEGPDLVLELVNEEKVVVGQRSVGPYREEIFSLATPKKPDKKSPAYNAIKRAVAHVKKRTATQLSAETHEFSLSWQEGVNGQELNVYLDLLTEEEHHRIRNQSRHAAAAIEDVFGSDEVLA